MPANLEPFVPGDRRPSGDWYRPRDEDDGGSSNDSMAALTTAADRYGDAPAVRFQRDGEWVEWTYTELGERVQRFALGLVGLGVEAGDRVCILANTRVEFTVANLGAASAGAVVVPVYPSNSPDECQWVVGNSGGRLIVCEDETQVAKIELVRDALPDLEHVVTIDGRVDGTLSMEEVEARGADVDPAELRRRAEAVRPDDACLIIYTSGTTGRPKGVVLTHKGFAVGRQSAVEMDLFGGGDSVYLFLPLAHVFAQLVQADCIEVGAQLAYWGGDATQIVGELAAIKPTVLPSVPRIFEKVYALAMGMVPPGDEERVAQAIQLGLEVRQGPRDGTARSRPRRRPPSTRLMVRCSP